MNKAKDDMRIQELIAELGECREDERNMQNQILQVISVAATVLGILFGASYFKGKGGEKSFKFFADIRDNGGIIAKYCNSLSQYITFDRIMFWLGLIIFCTAFAYVIVLGIQNALRYYYIQELEDRLHELIPDTSDDGKQGSFLHWNAFLSPIITRNITHIKSSYTFLAHCCYTIAVSGVVMFSIIMLAFLYLVIEGKTSFDEVILALFIVLMFLVMFTFLWTSWKTRKMAHFAWDMARSNREKRKRKDFKNLYKSDQLPTFHLLYLIYPKTKDLQKPLLIILGFIYGCFYSNVYLERIYIQRLFLVLFIFDVLAYQARYQINDLRGIKEDEEAGCTNRLMGKGVSDQSRAIKISFTVALLKIVASILITLLWGGEVRFVLLVCLVLLAVCTLIYEGARAKEKAEKCIFCFVGSGYALRFFVGFFSVVPFTSMMQSVTQDLPILFLGLALWTYGSFAAILPWTNEVIARIQNINNPFPPSYRKKHYQAIHEIIGDRYRKEMPLREKGSLKDPWNAYMLACMVFLFLFVCCEKMPLGFILVEALICVLFAFNVFLEKKMKLIPMCFGWLLIIGKAVWNIYFDLFSIQYILFSILQIIITGTYFVLYYQPQFKARSVGEIFESLIKGPLKRLCGEVAFNIVYDSKDND